MTRWKVAWRQEGMRRRCAPSAPVCLPCSGHLFPIRTLPDPCLHLRSPGVMAAREIGAREQEEQKDGVVGWA